MPNTSMPKRNYVSLLFELYKQRKDFRVYIEIILSIITVTMFSIFALKPTVLTVSELIKEIEIKEEIILTMDQKIVNLDIAQSLYTSDPRIILVTQAITTVARPEIFVRQLEALSATKNVTIEGISLDDAMILGESTAVAVANPETPGIKELEFTINISGAYENLINFLSDFSKLRRPLLIDSANIAISPKEDTSALVLSIEGRIPFLPK